MPYNKFAMPIKFFGIRNTFILFPKKTFYVFQIRTFANRFAKKIYSLFIISYILKYVWMPGYDCLFCVRQLVCVCVRARVVM